MRRFVDAEAVLRTAGPQEGKPPRHIYTITRAGCELLHDMPTDFPEDVALNDAEFLARAGNFRRLDESDQLVVLDTRDRVIAAEQKRLSTLAAAQTDNWSRVALRHLCDRYTAEKI